MASGRRAATFPEWKLDRIVKLRDEEGLGFPVIGQRLGISSSAANSAYHRRKGSRPGEARRDIPAEPAARAYRDGASLARIANAANCSKTAARRAVVAGGAEIRPAVHTGGSTGITPEAQAALERLREALVGIES